MEKDRKLDIIEANRPSVEDELYRAELDLRLAGDNEALKEGPSAAVEEAKRKLKVLDDEVKKAK